MSDRLPPFALLAVAAVLVPGTMTLADVITVDDDDPLADFATIQEAVDVAVDGDRIEVGPGYYFSLEDDGVPVVFVSGKSIEIVATSADPAATVISGQGVRRCVEWELAAGACKFAGFTLQSGFANLDGGGLLIAGAALEVEDCVFDSCVAGREGGAIGSRSESFVPPLARNCRFLSNVADLHGGAIAAAGGFDLFGCRFSGNASTIYGGGVFLDGDPAGIDNYSIVSECGFSACTSEYGGGLYGFDANLRIDGTQFSGCLAGSDVDMTGWGGGIGLIFGSLDMIGGAFTGCEGGESSGGLDVEQAAARIVDVDFESNVSHGTSAAVYAFGAGASLRFEDCAFTANAAQFGGGGAIVCSAEVASLELDRCTFDDNFAFGTTCISAPNVVTARDCEFNEQDGQVLDGVGLPKVSLSRVGSGSRFIGCRFIDGFSPDVASAVRAVDIGGLEFVDCDFLDNQTLSDGGNVEGAVYVSANQDNDDPIRFVGCHFAGNASCCVGEGFFAAVGGAIHVVGREAAISFCVFGNNQGIEGGSLRGLLHLSNCDLYGLSSLGYGGAASLLGGSSLTNCRVSGSADCNYPWIHASGPITVDGCTMTGSFPEGFSCFKDPADLAGCAFVKGTTVRNTRFCDYDPAAIHGAWTDLGGNSFHPDGCEDADLDGDGQVDGADLALVLAAWGTPCLGCAADVNRDGEVDGADLALVLAAWG